MEPSITVPKWAYHDQNVQSELERKDFTRADRVILYAAPTPLKNQPYAGKGMSAIGMVQSFSHNENKQLQQLFELGSSVPMIVPGLTTGSFSLSRVAISGLDLINTIYHGSKETKVDEKAILRSLRDINSPFDLMIAKYPVYEDQVGTKALSTRLFRGCHIQGINESISAGGVVVFEQLNVMYEYIPKATFSLEGTDERGGGFQ